jgi:hypothetical protein
MKDVPTVSNALLTLVEILAKPVTVTLPLFIVLVTVNASWSDTDPATVRVSAMFAVYPNKFHLLTVFPRLRWSWSGIKLPSVVPEKARLPPTDNEPETLKSPWTLLVPSESYPKSIFSLLFAVDIC